MKLRPFFSIFFLSFCMTTLTYAAHPDTGPGCGLGKLAWGDYPNQQDVGPQTFMSTTNLTFGTQSFGVSSGTSGCTSSGEWFNNEKVGKFSEINFDNLAREIAQGEGEHLTSLAFLMGILPEDQPKFFNSVQKEYSNSLKSNHPTSRAVIYALYKTLDNPSLTAHLQIPK